jgi:hypothetical protein
MPRERVAETTLFSRRRSFAVSMVSDLNLELGKLLDQYDEKRRAVEERRQQVKKDEDDFLKGFADLRTNVVKPVFEAIGVILKERGHDFEISEEEYAGEPGGKTTEAAVSIRVRPAGMEMSSHDDAQSPSLSFVTRHYNKSVWIHSNNAVPQLPQSRAAVSPRGDYQLAQIDKDLVQAELLKLIAGMVNR